MKIISIIKRKNLKYMPSYQWEAIGFDEEKEWFRTSHKTKWGAYDSAKKLKINFPDLIIKI